MKLTHGERDKKLRLFVIFVYSKQVLKKGLIKNWTVLLLALKGLSDLELFSKKNEILFKMMLNSLENMENAYFFLVN